MSALHGRLTRGYIVRRALRSYLYACNSYRKGKLRVYLIITLSILKVSGARAPLGPTVDTPLNKSDGEEITLGRSLTYIKNKSGPNTDP